MPEIDFLSIPADHRDPGQYIELDNRFAQIGLPTQPHRILYIGQKLAAGTAAALTPTRLYSDDQAKALFGRGSMLAAMWKAGGKVDTSTERWAIALADLEAGVQAAGSYTFVGPSTKAGTGALMIGGRSVKFGIASGATAAQMATSAAAAINADLDLPVTAAVDGVDTTKVNVTARHKGEEGNAISLLVNYYEGEALPEGATVTIAAMANGTGNPDITSVFTAIGDAPFQTFIMPFNDEANRLVLETELAARAGPMKQIEGLAYAAKRASHGALLTFGETRNSEFTSTLGIQGMINTPWETAAAYGAASAFACRVDPAQPLQTVPLPGLLAPSMADQFNSDKRNIALHNGIAVAKVDEGGVVRIQRAITHYRANAFGLPDESYLDSETLRTLFYIRFDLRAMVAQRFPRSKLGDNGAVGKGVMTPDIMYDQIIGRAILWLKAGLIEDLDGLKENLIVQRSISDRNRLDARIPANVINGLRTFAGQIQLIL